MNLLRTIIDIVLIVALTILAFFRSAVYLDETTLWSDTAVKSPNKERVQYNLGHVLVDAKRLEEAIPLFERALILKPKDLMTLDKLAIAYYDIGFLSRSEQCYASIIEYYPFSKEAKFARKMIALMHKRGEQP